MSDVATKTAAASAGDEDRALARALLGGTRAMREAGTTYLPKWPNESKAAYDARLATAVLFPAYSRTVDTLAGKPFSHPITIGDDVPPKIREWCEDIDLQGRNLHAFCAEVFADALGMGMAGILVDYPRTDGVRTLADERSAGARPYFVHIRAQDILGWRARRVGGVWRVEQLRFMERVEEPDGEFGERTIEQVRVLTPGAWQTYRKNAGGVWVPHEAGASTIPVVPFVPVYGKRAGFMMGEMPLLEVAHLNVAHWQSASDQQTILHAARVPILFARGFGDTDTIEVGAAAAVKSTQTDADLKFVEHSGAAISAGRQDLIDLEERMRQAGAELLVIQPGRVTATQINTENAVGMSALQKMAQSAEDSFDAALQLMADWSGERQGGHVRLFNDYGAATLAEASAQVLLTAATAGKISDRTLIQEYKRRGILSADVDPDDERERLSEQGPALGTMSDADANGQ